MAILRTIKCDVKGCTIEDTEQHEGEGWKGWGQLNGIALDGKPNPALCPWHLHNISEFIGSLGVEDD